MLPLVFQVTFSKIFSYQNVSSNIRVIKSRRMRREGHVACMGEMGNAFNILIGKPEGKRPLGRTKRRWEYNNRLDLREVGWECVDWLHLAQDRDQLLAL
jgi:hypothetical protein